MGGRMNRIRSLFIFFLTLYLLPWKLWKSIGRVLELCKHLRDNYNNYTIIYNYMYFLNLIIIMIIAATEECSSYLNRIQGLLRNIGVLRRPQLILLSIRDKHGCELVALVGDKQLWPLGIEGTSQLRIQVHHLRSEQHLGLLLLQHKLW